MIYRIKDIADILHTGTNIVADQVVEHLLIDSRKVVFPQTSLFFAIRGPRRNGHQYISEVYERGVRAFVVEKIFDVSPFADAAFLVVENVLDALQQLAAFHRSRFHIPVIGITGSNGKTIVKEWLYQLLQSEYNIVRSPRSFNSQLGVPLSVWQMNEQHTLAIFEAGISAVSEMQSLQKMIQPTQGVFTNLGDAHNEGFTDHQQKAQQKIKLFEDTDSLVIGKETLQHLTSEDFLKNNIEIFSWSRETGAVLQIISEERKNAETVVSAKYKNENISVIIPFTDRVSIDNAITCWCFLLQMNYADEIIHKRMLLLEPVEMRMQLKKAINNCYLLNDSYSNDLSSLDLAIDYLQQQAGDQSTTLILSDILQSGLPENILYEKIAAQIRVRGIHKLVGIGPAISRQQQSFAGTHAFFYPSTDLFLQQTGTQQFKDEYILLKGARVFEFEKISAWLEQKVHQTVMEINLSAMIHNLKEYQKLVKPSTRLMAMVKAFSYGSGSAEVARILQFYKVDYLAVAYADEGVELRKAGISLPIMVMNADAATFNALITYNLEPEIYSFSIYHSFHQYLLQQGIQQFPVHIKFNTGMNRLGFETTEAEALGGLIKQNHTMAVRSVFSHLVASESATHDGFTQHQVTQFEEACSVLQKHLSYPFIKHIANSAAILRKPEYQFDMVRLGIGLYGVDSANGDGLSLQTVATLKSTIAQIRKVKAGDTVGYGRKGKLFRDTEVATVRIGYADGYGREMSNGKGKMYIHGKLAPVIGSVCMDMTMIDITDIGDVKEGDEVEIFGPHLPVWEMAEWGGTISYEIMTGISQRVKRVYTEE